VFVLVDLFGVILDYLACGDFDLVDYLSRCYALGVYCSRVRGLSWSEILGLIDRVTGGLGYRRGDFDVGRMGYVGSIIAWPEVIPSGGRVLEIGTGIGRTCYVAVNWSSPSLFLTVDCSPDILAIALYRNPVRVFRDSLYHLCVRICFGDAIDVVKILFNHGFRFDHIIHDGGPNPRRNPRLYSFNFLKLISDLLVDGGSLSIFAGRDRRWQDRIYNILRKLGFKVESISFPDSPTLVFHAIKI